MNYLFLIATLLQVGAAWAAGPTRSPECSSKIQVRGVSGGAGVFFDQSCQTAFVLPPAHGKLELNGVSVTASPEDCRELAALESRRAELAEELKKLSAPTHKAPAIPGSTLGLSGGLTQPEPNPSIPEPTHDRDADRAETTKILAQLNELREATKIFSDTEGLSAKLIYTLNHDSLVQKYQQANPGIKIWARLPLERAYLTIVPKSEKLRDERSAVIDYSVPGLAKFPMDGDIGEKPTPANSVFFGEALSGSIRLNMKAACAVMDGRSHAPSRLSASQLETFLAANITYTYPLQVKRKYKAWYSLHSLVERIQSATKKGGFLSTKTVNELITSNDSGSWFRFISVSEDPRYPVEALAQTIKAELIERTLNQIAIARLPGQESAPPLLEPGRKGVDVAAAGLKKCPNAYCQVAGYVLDFVGATFGSSNAVSRFLSSVQSESVEEVEESRAFRFYGTSTFRDTL